MLLLVLTALFLILPVLPPGLATGVVIIAATVYSVAREGAVHLNSDRPN